MATDWTEIRRLALILEYDGTRYNGFQWQSNAPSIQAELERALSRFTGETIRVRGASRTDVGVHAKGQVVDFLTRAPYTIDTFVNALNWHLSLDIKVRGAYHAALELNSRADALSRGFTQRARWWTS
jgi:tRNA pseudouridine38-40 synthase